MSTEISLARGGEIPITTLAAPGLTPYIVRLTGMSEALQYAEMISRSGLCPKDYRGKPEDCFIAMQFGAELGLNPIQSLNSIAVINGRPGVWGDGFLALIQRSAPYEWHTETFDEATFTATVSFKRRGNPTPFVKTFSKADAQKASLWGKAGPWTTNPREMVLNRARAFAGRAGFADVLKGIAMVEEVMDYTENIVAQPALPGPPTYAATATVAPAASAASTTSAASGMPQRKSAPPGPGPVTTGPFVTITNIELGESKPDAASKWTRWRVSFSDGTTGTTFSGTLGAAAEAAWEKGSRVVASIEATAKGPKLADLRVVSVPDIQAAGETIDAEIVDIEMPL